MTRFVIFLAFWMGAPVAYALDEIALPSGLTGKVYETKTLETTDTYLGVMVPDLSSVDYDVALKDLDHICAELVQTQLEITSVVIRIMDAELDYGDADPEINQFMSFYSVIDGVCEWQ